MSTKPPVFNFMNPGQPLEKPKAFSNMVDKTIKEIAKKQTLNNTSKKVSGVTDSVLVNGIMRKVVGVNEKPKSFIDTITSIIKQPDYNPFSEIQNKYLKNNLESVEEQGGVLNKQNRFDLIENQNNKNYNEYINGYMDMNLNILDVAYQSKQISKEEIFKIFNPNYSTDDLSKEIYESEIEIGARKIRDSSLLVKNRYSDINWLKDNIGKDKSKFFLARSNINGNEYENTNLYGTNLYHKGKVTEKAKSRESKDNYLMNVMDRLDNWVSQNKELNTVKDFKKQGYTKANTNAKIYSKNLQAVKEANASMAEIIINQTYADNYKKKEFEEQFGILNFTKDKKPEYDMSKFKEQLTDAFDDTFTYNENYFFDTQYGRSVTEYDKNNPNSVGNIYTDREEGSNMYINPGKNNITNFFGSNLRGPGELSKSKPYTNFLGTKFSGEENRPFSFDYMFQDSEKPASDTKDKYFVDGYTKTPIPLVGDFIDVLVRSFIPSDIKGSAKTTYSKAMNAQDISKYYNNLFNEAAEKIYTDSDDGIDYIKKIPLPFLASIDEDNSGSGIVANGIKKEMKISFKNEGKVLEDAIIFKSFFNDDYLDNVEKKINGTEARISINGAGLNSYQDADIDDKANRDKYKLLMKEFRDYIPKNPGSVFSMEALPYAAENPNLEAMIVFPSKAFLAQKVKDETITKEEKEQITLNGITIFAKQNSFNNPLMMSRASQIELFVDREKEYKYTDKDSGGTYTITKNPDNPNEYITTLRVPKSDGTQRILRNVVTRFGNRLTESLDNALDFFDSLNDDDINNN